MKRINNIVTTVTAPADNPGTFDELPLSAKTKVVFSVANRILAGIKWWQPHIDDEDASAEFRKRAVKEVKARQNAFTTLVDFMNRAANYTSGKDTETCHDISGRLDVDSLDAPVEGYEFSFQVLSSNPYAWAREMLLQRGDWPQDWQTPDSPMTPILWDIHKTFDRYAARYIALTILAEMGMYQPPQRKDDDTPSDIVLIASCSPQLQLINSKTRSHAQILKMCVAMLRNAFGQNPLQVSAFKDGERVTQSFTIEQMLQAIKDAEELDADDLEQEKLEAEEAEAKAERKSLIHEIKTITRTAITTTVVMKEMATAAATMKEAGVGDAAIEAMMASVMTKLGLAAPAAPAPVTTE